MTCPGCREEFIKSRKRLEYLKSTENFIILFEISSRPEDSLSLKFSISLNISASVIGEKAAKIESEGGELFLE